MYTLVVFVPPLLVGYVLYAIIIKNITIILNYFKIFINYLLFLYYFFLFIGVQIDLVLYEYCIKDTKRCTMNLKEPRNIYTILTIAKYQ